MASAKWMCAAATIASLAWSNNACATEAQYDCSGGTRLTAQFSVPGAGTGHVMLIFATGRRLTLPQVVSADGGRYANDEMEFWVKGRGATLTRGGTSETCSAK